MDCGTGAALGQQLAKNAFYMQGAPVAGPSAGSEQDALIAQETMMQPLAAGNWAQQHLQTMAMQCQQNEAFMLRCQQQQMEEAFRASSAMQQQQQQQRHHHHSTAGGVVLGLAPPPQLMPLTACGAGVGGFMMAPFSALPCAPMAGLATMNTMTAANETTTTATLGQRQHGDDGWAERLRDVKWAQDYSDAQVFTVDGQPEQTMEEHAKKSMFYQFMDKIRTKELLIDEENGQVVEGPGPDVDVPEDAEYLEAFMKEENIQLDSFDFMRTPRNKEKEDRVFFDASSGNADNLDVATDIEEWAREYNEMQEQMRRAQNTTDYPFEPNNPYMYHDNPMEEGHAMIKMANLAEAALAFEAVCQKEPECEEGWRLLGTTQAENEKDNLAIIALNRARMLDSKDCAVHAALAVSHTNEHNVRAALESLRAWLLSNPQYEQLGSVRLDEADSSEAVGEMEDDYFYAAPKEYRECRTLLNAALEMNPGDPQLHSSLGVLHSISHNFDAAAANFRAAVELCPEDANLWNKLGATLANGNKPQEALEAYNRALDLNPGYVRVMYNMAVSYSNMAEYQKAAKQITRAIAVQAGGTNPQGEGSRLARLSLWDMLRMTLNLMDRNDLVELTWAQDVTPFLKEFGMEGMVI